jgi:SAM-dependent methyltransferase
MTTVGRGKSPSDAACSGYAQAIREARGPDAAIAQQGLLPSSEVLALGKAVGAAPAKLVLDACCGTGGPAALLAEHFGARMVGVDITAASLQRAVKRPGLAGRCAAANATRLPFHTATFDAVVLFDSLVSIANKVTLTHEIARVLVPGGRFACTDLLGEPLSAAERSRLPPEPEPHLVTLATLTHLLERAGLAVESAADYTDEATTVAGRLAAAFDRHAEALTREMGADAARDLRQATACWADLLARRRLALFAVVAERVMAGSTGANAENEAMESPRRQGRVAGALRG